MSDLKDYQLRRGMIYIESVRVGPITDSVPYRMPFHSNMDDDDPLKQFLQAKGLEVAALLSGELGGKHIRLTIMVEEEEIES